MKQNDTSMTCAGIDVGKLSLDVAIDGGGAAIKTANDAAGIARLIDWLKAHGAMRVGLEATGGYERGVCMALREAGFEVVLHQPLEVRLFARLTRRRAKNDRLDASLIAAATRAASVKQNAHDSGLLELAERLTAYEQASDLIAQMKTAMEHVTLSDMAVEWRAKIAAMTRMKMKIAAKIIAAVKARPDLAARYKLLRSLPGFGPIVAIALVVRMPELGAMERGQAAALLGVAPFDRDSGQYKGQRRIAGGRARPRRLMYMAALAARRCDPGFKAFAQNLLARGKPPKVAIVAVMRKLIEAANLVLSRGQPWRKTATA